MFIEVVCLYLMSVMRVASGDVVQDPQGYISPAQQEVHYDIKYYNPEEVLEEHHGYDVVTEVTSAYIQKEPQKVTTCGKATSRVTATQTFVMTNTNVAQHTEINVSVMTSSITSTVFLTSEVFIEEVVTMTGAPGTEIETVYLTDTNVWTKEEHITESLPVTVAAPRTVTEVAAITEVVTVTSTRPEFETTRSTVVSLTTSSTTEVVPSVSTMTVTSTYHDIVQVVETDTTVVEVWHTVWQTAKETMLLQETQTRQETVTVTDCERDLLHDVMAVFG
ncbi:zonadhesin-like [Penaeus japonicus]|uniref:zonadhesin-like n=1 Tax=Penaeus japonicus TaxID=27405 RepID=UPI001C70D8FF|nr:zonadhesin-like [Penaeus japonicus]